MQYKMYTYFLGSFRLDIGFRRLDLDMVGYVGILKILMDDLFDVSIPLQQRRESNSVY